MQRRQAIFSGTLAALGLAAGAAWIAGSKALADGAPAGARGRSRANSIPNVEVVNQHGQGLRFYDDVIKNKVVMVNAFFAECGEVCPLVTQNLQRVYGMFGGRVGRDVHMISITLQPERDSPELLKQFAEVYGIGAGWQLLTGTPEDMLAVRRSLNFYDPDPELDLIADTHTGILRYGNDRLRRWAGCPALGRPEGIYHSVTGSVMDAGIGQPAVPAAAVASGDNHHHQNSKI